MPRASSPQPRVTSGVETSSNVAERFATIAERIDAQASVQSLTALFATTRQVCRDAAARATSVEQRDLLVNVQQALQTWIRVWPRLGTQPVFRHAVAREARLWARRFAHP